MAATIVRGDAGWDQRGGGNGRSTVNMNRLAEEDIGYGLVPIPLSCVVDGGIRCTLCPHFCILGKGVYGKCRSRYNDGDIIRYFHHGQSVITVDYLSNKPITHFSSSPYPVLSVGLLGCNLSCRFCENAELSQSIDSVALSAFSVGNLILMAQHYGCRGICLTYSEPIVAFEYISIIAHQCHANDLTFFLKTNAYINSEPWSYICRMADAINIDWKGTATQYERFCGAFQYVVEDRIKEAYNLGTHIEINIPLYPLDDRPDKWEYMGRYLASINPEIPAHIIPINPAHKWIDRHPIEPVQIEIAEKVLREYLAFVDHV